MQVNKEHETEFGHTLCVYSEEESHCGKTLVTLGADERVRLNLFPEEARALADALNRAADLAQGV
jgi:hypothetical protein